MRKLTKPSAPVSTPDDPWAQLLRSEDGAEVIAFRHPETNQPIAVPKELALTESRTYRAYTDHLQGKTWEQIAEDHSYADVRAIGAALAAANGGASAVVEGPAAGVPECR